MIVGKLCDITGMGNSLSCNCNAGIHLERQIDSDVNRHLSDAKFLGDVTPIKKSVQRGAISSVTNGGGAGSARTGRRAESCRKCTLPVISLRNRMRGAPHRGMD